MGSQAPHSVNFVNPIRAFIFPRPDTVSALALVLAKWMSGSRTCPGREELGNVHPQKLTPSFLDQNIWHNKHLRSSLAALGNRKCQLGKIANMAVTKIYGKASCKIIGDCNLASGLEIEAFPTRCQAQVWVLLFSKLVESCNLSSK